MRIIDAHAHIASWPSLGECEEVLLESLEKYGISFTLVSNADAAEFPSVPTARERVKDQLECLKETVDFCKRSHGRVGAAIWIRPFYEREIPQELIDYIKENRRYIHAFKFHPYDEKMRSNDPALFPYYELALELGLPFLVHTAADEWSRIDDLAEMAEKYPDLIFIAAHLELCSDNEHAIEVMKRHPSIYGDTAWVPMEKALKCMKECGVDHLMFGTDNPIDGLDTLDNPMYREYYENAYGLSEEDLEALMFGNAMRIYQIP